MSAGTESVRGPAGAVDGTGDLHDEFRTRLEVILKEILAAKELELNAEQPLRDQGFDSADTLTLLSELESQFKVTLDDADVDESNLFDVQSVVGLLVRKVGGASGNLR